MTDKASVMNSEGECRWAQRFALAGAALAVSTALTGCGFVFEMMAAHAIVPEVIRRILTGQSTDPASVAQAVAVRPDVAAWVNGQRQLTPQQTAALMQLARATQATLSVNLSDRSAVSKAATQQIAAVQCASYQGVQFAMGPSIDAVVTNMTTDTPAKQAFRQAFNVAVGALGQLRQVAGSGCASA